MSDLFQDIARVRLLVDEVKATSSTDINKLIELNRKLSIYSYYLAEGLGTLHKAYTDNEAQRKYELGRFMKDTDLSITKAEKVFYYESDTFKLEKQSESGYKNIKQLLEQVNNITRVLSVEISNLKQERSNSKGAT